MSQDRTLPTAFMAALLAGTFIATGAAAEPAPSGSSAARYGASAKSILATTPPAWNWNGPAANQPAFLLTPPKPDFNWGWRFFQPKSRIYFDTGSDDEGEVDIFDDGALTVSVNVAELRLDLSSVEHAYNEAGEWVPEHFKRSDWSWGFNFGLGIGAPAEDSETPEAMGGERASNAPVLLLTGGIYFEFGLGTSELGAKFNEALPGYATNMKSFGLPPATGPKLVIEGGYAQGLSADESFGDISDGAAYVGVGIHVPF